MEDNNMARIELDEQQMEDVVGGAFHFQYNRKGDYVCKVDGVGVYYAKESAKRAIAVYDAQNPGLGDAALTQWAIANGYLWEP